MKIESVERHKGGLMAVTLENGDTLYIHTELAAANGLCPGVDCPPDVLERLSRQTEFRRARERALYLLEYRDHSYMELYRKLEKTYGEEIARKITDKMAKLGFVDDEKYGRRLAASLIEGKHYGLRRARYEMSLKGLDRSLIDEVLADYEDEDDQLARIVELIERKYARSLGDPKGMQRVIGALARMGHSYSDIRAAIGQFTDEADSIMDDIEE